MKIQTNTKFSPIEIKITVENIDELKYFWGVTNMPISDVQKQIEFNSSNVANVALWERFDNLLKYTS